jgi:NAD(P)-dependent dehydrogenase (short-subunit alcohol dehydrogenase family)
MASREKKSDIIFITGVSTGIGRALAIAAVESGFQVIGSVRRASDSHDLASELGSGFKAVILDVTDLGAVNLLAGELFADLGPGGLHSLINNAGISVQGALSEIDDVSLSSQFNVNVLAPVNLTRAFLPLLERPGTAARSRSLIVNISSMVIAINPPLSGAYTASKAALEAFSHAWRRELSGKGINVMIVRPGAVRSDIWEKGEAGPPEPDSFFTGAHQRKAALSAQGLKGAYDCDEFGLRVVRLITRRRPPVLVTVSREPWYARKLPSLLPWRWADRLIRLVMRLPD